MTWYSAQLRKVRHFLRAVNGATVSSAKSCEQKCKPSTDRNQITVSGMMITDKCMSCVPRLWWWCVSTSEPKDEKAVNS